MVPRAGGSKNDKFETCLVDCDVRVQWTSFVMSLVLV